MTEIISFYSVAPSQGKRTTSLAFAEMLVEQKHRVLYVELDYSRPNVVYATHIQHPEKNVNEYFTHVANTGNFFYVEPFILTKEDILQHHKSKKKIFERQLPNKLDYLILRKREDDLTFPTLIHHEDKKEEEAKVFIESLFSSLKELDYHYIIVNTTYDISHLFGYEVLHQSDYIINVLTSSPTVIVENQKTIHFLSNNMDDLEGKWRIVLNMANMEIDAAEYESLIGTKELYLIPYDRERQAEELSLRLGSDLIKQSLESLAMSLNIMISSTKPTKRSFFRKGV